MDPCLTTTTNVEYHIDQAWVWIAFVCVCVCVCSVLLSWHFPASFLSQGELTLHFGVNNNETE